MYNLQISRSPDLQNLANLTGAIFEADWGSWCGTPHHGPRKGAVLCKGTCPCIGGGGVIYKNKNEKKKRIGGEIRGVTFVFADDLNQN